MPLWEHVGLFVLILFAIVGVLFGASRGFWLGEAWARVPTRVVDRFRVAFAVVIIVAVAAVLGGWLVIIWHLVANPNWSGRPFL